MTDIEPTMTVTTAHEITLADAVKPTVPDVSLDPLDFQKEIARIAAEQGNKIENGNVVPASQEPTPTQAVTQPARPQAVTQPVVVPEKFQTQDGQVDLEKVQKSTINADEALKKYAEKETELRNKMNAVRDLQQTVQSPPTAPAPISGPQITSETINKYLEQTKNPGQVFLELTQLAAQNGYLQAKQEFDAKFSEVSHRIDQRDRTFELSEIAKKDPTILSDEGFKALAAIREAKPWLNHAPEPWREAYLIYKAERDLQAGAQVQPNPNAQTVRVPPTPVQGGPRPTQPQAMDLNRIASSQANINKFLDSLPDEAARTAFFRAALPGAK